MASVAEMRLALEKWSVEELTSYTENAGFPFVNFACEAVSSAGGSRSDISQFPTRRDDEAEV